MNTVSEMTITADQLRGGDRIVLTISEPDRTATGHVFIHTDTELGRSSSFVMPPTQQLRVIR